MTLSLILISFALFAWKRDVAERIVILVVSMALAYESVLGFGQLFGFAPTGGGRFLVTGSFENPGPYGGFVSVCTVVALSSAMLFRKNAFLADKALVVISGICGALGAAVLPSSMSRTGWAALIAASAVFLLREDFLRSFLRRHKWIVVLSSALFIALCILAFSIKRDSALGRLHIWKMELRSIAASPLTGHGHGSALGAYGEAQAEYFESAVRSPERVQIAGCPEYAFNEYLKFGVEGGIPTLILSLVILWGSAAFLILRRSPLGWGLLAWDVFAFASYPLSVWQLKSLLLVFLGAAAGTAVGERVRRGWIPAAFAVAFASLSFALTFNELHRHCEAERCWKEEQRAAAFGIGDGESDRLAELYPYLKDEYKFLYDYGYALHRENRYEESTAILREGASKSCDPMFYDIIGKNMESLGRYSEAEECWMKAHYMVPSRLYPYILLMEMYDRLGNVERARFYAGEALAMNVNPRNMAMRELRLRARTFLEEHEPGDAAK